MLRVKKFLNQVLAILFLILGLQSPALAIEVAVTVDGLPAHGEQPPHSTRIAVAKQMIAAFNKHHVHGVYGMVVGNLVTPENQGYAVLKTWLDSGNYLGNHSFSHWDLANTDPDKYIEDIRKTDRILAKAVTNHSNYKYFRYPYNSEGATKKERDQVREYLFKDHYQIAPVSMDFLDYLWDEAYDRCLKKNDQQAITWLKETYIESALNSLKIYHILSEKLFHRDIKYILLLHIGDFDAVMMDDLLTAYKNHGVKFITLPEALTDKAYKINTEIVQPIGYSFISQVRQMQKMEIPKEVTQLVNQRPVKKLNQICR